MYQQLTNLKTKKMQENKHIHLKAYEAALLAVVNTRGRWLKSEIPLDGNQALTVRRLNVLASRGYLVKAKNEYTNWERGWLPADYRERIIPRTTLSDAIKLKQAAKLRQSTISLPTWMWEWMDSHPEISRSQHIMRAMMQANGLSGPKQMAVE